MSVKRDHPDVLFLSEAFTRPKVMYRLAKLGFTQSYTYFAWRQTKSELTQYFTELTKTEVREFFLSEPLAQHSGYFDRATPTRRPGGIRVPLYFGCYAGSELWHLWSDV